MGMFTQIPLESFKEMQLNAGIVVTYFDPKHPNIACYGKEHTCEGCEECGCKTSVKDKKCEIIAATKGGITINCTPTYSDLGSDVDNCPANLLELKHLDSWDCGMSFTSVTLTKSLADLAIGAVISDTNGQKPPCGQECTTCETCKCGEDGKCQFKDMTEYTIKPRIDVKESDFKDIWWIGDLMGGGFVAICIKNALCTSGFSLKTTKNGKGEVALTMTGHVKAASQKDVPMELYVATKSASEAA